MIFAPCPYKREVARDDGETKIDEGVFFRALHVFGIVRTDGPDLATVEVPTVDTVADDLLAGRWVAIGVPGMWWGW